MKEFNVPTVQVDTDGNRTVYGETYLQHCERFKQLQSSQRIAERDDRRSFPRSRVTSSTRLVSSALDIELEAMILTNPNLNDEERQKELDMFRRIKSF